MGERFWFAGRLTDDMKIVYLFSAPSKIFALDVMLEFAASPVIEQLTWARISKITGCVIPADSTQNDYAVGHIIMHSERWMDLVLLPV